MKIKNIIAIGCAICLSTVPFSLTACEQELEDAIDSIAEASNG